MNETFIFFKIRFVLKKYRSIETEAVFSKTDMNNKRNFPFLQNTSCVEKVSMLKLYLQRQE